MDGPAARELETLRFEVDALRQKLSPSSDPQDVMLTGVLRGMISDRELHIRELEQPPAA